MAEIEDLQDELDAEKKKSKDLKHQILRISTKPDLNLSNSAEKNLLADCKIKTQASDDDNVSYNGRSPENASFQSQKEDFKMSSSQQSNSTDSFEMAAKRRKSHKKQNKTILISSRRGSISDHNISISINGSGDQDIFKNFRENYKKNILNVNNSFKHDKSKGPKSTQISTQESTKKTILKDISIQCDLILDKIIDNDHEKEIDELKERIDKKDWEIRKLTVIIEK